MSDLAKSIKHFNPCKSAVDWLAKQSSRGLAWENCERGDWMLWLVGKLSGPPQSASRKKLVLCCCECARLSLKHVPRGETRPLKAIETAERWARGDASVTLEDVQRAAYVAYAVYTAAYAIYTAAYAADAAVAAAAAIAVADDAAAAADAAAADDAYAARKRCLKKCADIVRKHYSHPPRIPRRKP